MFKFLTKLVDSNEQTVKRYQKIVEKINSFENEIKQLTDEQLKDKTNYFKEKLAKGSSLEDILAESFAVVREASFRVNKQRHFDVQLMAGLTFHEGKVAEQKTGEGKTLSATTATYLNALTGKGVHVVTVNDYLAQRDGGWMAAVYHFLGLTTSVLIHETSLIYDPEFTNENAQDWRLVHLKPISRRQAYQADITYGTNNEFGFDYLRDNMVMNIQDKSQRGHYFAIVDEVDSILIDEARTPLIISAPDSDPTDKYYQFSTLIQGLNPKSDYVIDEKLRTAHLTEVGITKLEKKLGIDNLYEKDFETIHHVENALRARSLFEKDKHYVVKDGEIIIVDEFTGRLMYGRRYSEGLHQAIEAKEGVKVQQESKTLATISIQNYFRMYEKLSGMTGTAATEAEEFHKIYKMDVVVIPTNRNMVRKDLPDYIYKNERAKLEAIGREIEKIHQTGQPILVGTRDIEHNDLVVRLLKHKGIKHEVLNAKNHLREALVLAKAGEKGAVTIATNMAGRGVDIALGGDEPKMSPDKDPAQFEKEVEEWKAKRDEILALGGLMVIGSERHESRRIDNQLRGRAGRQGDPGITRFFVALDDEIMRIFGGDQIAKVMTMMKMPDNVPIEHGMVSKAIENAQTKVEGFYFDQRKHVVEYDDVMNKQREIIYGIRTKILESGEIKTDEKSEEIKDAAVTLEEVSKTEEVKAVVPKRILRDEIIEKLHAEVDMVIGIESDLAPTDEDYLRIVDEVCKIIPFDDHSRNHLLEELKAHKDNDKIATYLKDVLDGVYLTREQQFGESAIANMERAVYLSTLDELWINHLDQMTALRDGIGLRAYGQRDPLVEYKREAFGYFQRLLGTIDSELIHRIFRVLPNNAEALLMANAYKNIYELGPDQNAASSAQLGSATAQPRAAVPGSASTEQPDSQWKLAFQSAMSQAGSTQIKNEFHIGRNDPCWCGSGKKYKKCHFPEVPPKQQ